MLIGPDVDIIDRVGITFPKHNSLENCIRLLWNFLNSTYCSKTTSLLKAFSERTYWNMDRHYLRGLCHLIGFLFWSQHPTSVTCETQRKLVMVNVVSKQELTRAFTATWYKETRLEEIVTFLLSISTNETNHFMCLKLYWILKRSKTNRWCIVRFVLSKNLTAVRFIQLCSVVWTELLIHSNGNTQR